MIGLYELSNEYLQLMEMADEGELDPETLEEALLDLDDEIEIVAENCAKMLLELEGINQMLDTEIKRLQKKKSQNASNMDTIKKSLQRVMVVTKKEKFKTALFGFSIQKNPASVVLDQPDAVPDEYRIPQPDKTDTKKIKQFLNGLKSAADCTWAHLEQSRGLRIR